MHLRQAFILAAGYGTRLKPLTLTTPKPLLPIAGKPLLDYHILNLKKYGIQEVFINSFYLSEQIEEYAKSRSNLLKIVVSKEDSEILGTAGGIMKQIDKLDDIFLVVYGDNLTNFNYGKLFDYILGKEFDVLVCLYHEKNIKEKGMAILNEYGYITSFIEKPKEDQVVSDLANTGIYVIKKSIFEEFCPKEGFYDFGHDFFPNLLKNNKKILSYITNDYLLDIGNIENYNIANDYISYNSNLFD